jgi:putative peptidoglycan lipid II flippase
LMRRTLLQSLAVVAALAVLALLSLIYLGRPVIRILFERGEFNATAGDLTYLVLIAYAVALPAYVGTEVITRGLIALRDTRTPLLTNLLQLGGRTAIMALFVGRFGVVVVPAITATLEALTLGAVLLVRLQSRMRTQK